MLFSVFDGKASLETRDKIYITKTFDKVCHDGLLYKLKCLGVEGDLYNILKKYLLNRKQRVILNGQSSLWLDITATGSVLGALFLLININDLFENYLNYLPMTLTLLFLTS